MRQQQSFGKRGQSGNRRPPGPVSTRQTMHKTIDEYEDPVLTNFAVTRPWPAFAAAGITLVITAGLVVSGWGKGTALLLTVPVMLIVGYIMYLQFRGMQKEMQGERERVKRAIQAKYPLVTILGMIAGLVYFIVTKEQSLSDIFAYDWSGIFGLRTDIEAEEPLTATLLSNIGSGGGAGVMLAALWYRYSKQKQDRE